MGQNQALSLVRQLQEFQKAEDITPDRFYSNMDTLRAAISRQTDPATKAIYQATLAHILARNADNATQYRRDTESPADSMQEWTYQEYLHHASVLYKQSMSDMMLLHRTPASRWIPLVTQGKDQGVFNEDMLSVVWRAMIRDIDPHTRVTEGLPTAEKISSFYAIHGNREAAIYSQLECVWETDVQSAKDKLTIMREQYDNLATGAEVYLALADGRMTYVGMSDEERLAWLDKALEKWPDSPWKNNIENRKREITAPRITVTCPKVAYPLSKIKVPTSTRNIRDIRLSTYKLPLEFAKEGKGRLEEKNGKELLELIRKHGKRIKHSTLQPRNVKSNAQTCQDTIVWHSSVCGLYAIVLDATTDAAVANKPEPQVSIVRVSRLGFYHRTMPDGRVRITVVDSKTGSPMSGVTVEACTKENDNEEYRPITRLTTDHEGCAMLDKPDEKPIYIKVSRESDEAGEPQRLFYDTPHNGKEQKEIRHMAISTDRNIYRPGQQIMLSAVAYSTKGWDAQVIPNEECDVVLRDANNRKICQHQCKTDDMGVLKDTLTLPSAGLPGSYRIMVGNGSRTIRVEEYVRPTFKVELSQSKEYAGSKDSIAFEGKVTTYSGAPVAHARVTGRFLWTSSWWWKGRSEDVNGALDTIRTDNEGKFTYKLAITGTAEQLKRGRVLEANVDVLSAQGETQSGSLRIPVCSTPLRMSAEIPDFNDKEYPKPWVISLYSSTDKPVKGDITCSLTRNGQEAKTIILQAGVPIIPQELKEMESGCYDLHAQANINGDTASWRGSIELTSLTDTVLYHHTKLCLYCPKPYFSSEESAKVQIGSSLQDAWIRVMMESANGIAMDTLMRISNSLQTWDIPYRKEYGEGVTLSAYLFHKGSLESTSEHLKLKMPDYKLRMKWVSFRDHLRPGQKEEWTLSVLRPNGEPAKANITATLYDASLDALSQHHLGFNVYRGYSLPYTAAWKGMPYSYNRQQMGIYFTTRYKKEYRREFSAFNSKYDLNRHRFVLNEVVTTRGGKATLSRRYAKQAIGITDMKSMAFDSVEQALSGQIAGLDVTPEAALADGGNTVESDDEMLEEDMDNLRTELQETAFFIPDLRTDENGMAHICFTLPESMTSWHLLGAAHTTDMMTGLLDTLIVAEKELMAELHLPRFLRNGDQSVLTASIRNCSDKNQKGKGTLLVCDTETEKVLMRQRVQFQLATQADTTFRFPYTGSMEHTALTVKWMAQGENFSDGEQRYLPVLTDMQSITETKAFSLNTVGKHSISLEKLFAHNHQEATNRSLTVEYTRDPKWLAIQTLPSLALPRCKDVLSLSSAYYGGALAYSIGQKFPEVREAIKEWGTQDTAALESPLVRNQELSNTLLQETPWVMEAANERTRRQRLASLFNDVAQEDYRMNMLIALKNQQQTDGSFTWYPGMRGSEYLTLEVICRLARLYAMTGEEMPQQREMREKGCKYLLKKMGEEVKTLKKANKPAIGHNTMSALYALRLSGYNTKQTAEENASVNYMLSLLKKQAAQTDREERALAAVVLHLYGEKKQAATLMKRLHELLKQPDGMHLAYLGGGRTSIDRKTAEHVMMMEAIRTVEPDDSLTLNAMQEWLIGMKRTQEWENTSQTADAVYALLSSNSGFSKGSDELTLQVASKSHVIKSPETVLGYVRERTILSKAPRALVVDKKSAGTSFGAVYAQYQIPAQKTEAQQEGLNIRRDISRVESLHEGDRVHVRYTITADRDYEFVRLMAPRPAAAEPDVQTSGYRYTGHLGYYQAIHDASTEYFMDQLPRGTHVIEEDWLISREGHHTLPAAILQCLYAPDFQAHTAGTVMEVLRK